MKKKFNVNNTSMGGGTMKNLLFILAVAALLGAQASPAAAHSALLNCFDNADGTFTCQGGYSDGSSATGIRIVVRDRYAAILLCVRRGTPPCHPALRQAGCEGRQEGQGIPRALAAQSGHYGKECRAGDALSHMRAGVFPEPGEQTIPVSV